MIVSKNDKAAADEVETGAAGQGSRAGCDGFFGFGVDDIREPNTLSFACIAAWLAVVFCSGNLVQHFGGTHFLLDWSFQTTSAALMIASLLVACCARLSDRLLAQRVVPWIGSSLIAFGMILTWTIDQASAGRSLMSMTLFSVLCALGIMTCLLALGLSCRHLGGHLAAKTISFGLLVAFVIYAVALVLPDWFSFALMAALPPLSIAALRFVKPTLPHEDFERKERFSYRRFMLKMGTSCVVFAFSFSFLRYYNTQDWMLLSDPAQMSKLFGLYLVVLYVVATVLIRVTVLVTGHLELGYHYRVVLLYYILGLFVYPISLLYNLPGGTLGPCGLLTIGFVYFAMIVWIVMADVLFREAVSPSRVIGFGIFFLTLGISLGSLFGTVLPEGFLNQSLNAFVVCGILVILTFLVYSYLFTEKSVGIMGNGDMSKEFIEERHYERVCDEIAKAYHLSPRENDVLFLMACGKTAAEIMDELVISMGTFNTHSHHIYQKLHVHRRSELEAFIAGWKVGN